MHFSEWPGFVVGAVAMIFQIMEASRIADSMNLVSCHSFASFHWSNVQLSLDQDGITPDFQLSQRFTRK